jgi:hypothetical protein
MDASACVVLSFQRPVLLRNADYKPRLVGGKVMMPADRDGGFRQEAGGGNEKEPRRR